MMKSNVSFLKDAVVMNDCSIEGPIASQDTSGFTTGSGGKFVVLKLSPEAILWLFKTSGPFSMQVNKGRLPADAQVVETTWGIAGLLVAAVLHSEEFDEIPAGGAIPLWPDIEVTSL